MRRALPVLVLCAASCQLGPASPPRVATSDETNQVPTSRQNATPTASKTSAATPATPADTAPYSEPHDGALEDEVEFDAPKAKVPVRAHPLDGVSRAELERRLLDEPASLDSISIGRPSGGRLLNAVQMPADERWQLVDPGHAWATRETVDYLSRAIKAVHEKFPRSPKLFIGHLSAKDGGPIAPHTSHQSGRDVDISYFYSKGHRWYGRATAQSLDRARTWAFVRALVTETDVEMILIDAQIQIWLRDHALKTGEDPAWLESLFRGRGGLPPLIRHAKGHATHIHIRFHNPTAQETARRVYPLLLRHRKVDPPTQFVRHKVKNGETLGKLAKRYGTTIEAIQRANGLKKKTLIRAGRVYLVPRAGGAATTERPPAVPGRRLPPSASASGG